MTVHLLIIDPQNDFTDKKGALFVPGADEDMRRLTEFITTSGDLLDDIHVTLDSHREVDIAHPIFWVDSQGRHPAPFTPITLGDLDQGRWQTRLPNWNARARDYVQKLHDQGRYDLMIWPPHCVIGSWGHATAPALSDALRTWERRNFGIVNYVTKGSNIWTEHYSAVQAEVMDPADPTTQLNTELIDMLQNPEVDTILIAGEALSHCVANTIRDIADNFGEQNIRKFVLLRDCCSNVTGCNSLGDDFVTEMQARGMAVRQSTEDIMALV